MGPTPYDNAVKWVTDHGCINPIGRFDVQYKEVSRHVYQVTCNKCGKTTTIKDSGSEVG